MPPPNTPSPNGTNTRWSVPQENIQHEINATLEGIQSALSDLGQPTGQQSAGYPGFSQWLPDPRPATEQVQEASDSYRRRYRLRPPVNILPDDPAERLRTAAALVDSGLVSQEDFLRLASPDQVIAQAQRDPNQDAIRYESLDAIFRRHYPAEQMRELLFPEWPLLSLVPRDPAFVIAKAQEVVAKEKILTTKRKIAHQASETMRRHSAPTVWERLMVED